MRSPAFLLIATVSIGVASAIAVGPHELFGVASRQFRPACQAAFGLACPAETAALGVLQAGDNCTAQVQEFGETRFVSDSCCPVLTAAFNCWAEAASQAPECTGQERSFLANGRVVFAAACNPCSRLINLDECRAELEALAAPVDGVTCATELQDVGTMRFESQCCEVVREYLSCALSSGEGSEECDGTQVLDSLKDDLRSLDAGTCATATRTPQPGESPLPTPSSQIPPGESPTASPNTPLPSPESSPEGSPESSPSASDDPTLSDDDDVCFPGSATVMLEDGSPKSMAELRIGDKVQTGSKTFSEVYFFSHRIAEGLFKFVRITTSSNATLSLTGNHYIRTGAGSLVAAKYVKVGDQVVLGHGAASEVTGVAAVVDVGLYNPHTISGELVVDGVATSSYTTTVHPALAQVLLAPIRWVYRSGASGMRFLDNGASLFASFTPKGPLSA